MNAHGIEILHTAHCDHIARRIPHGFKFDLLPAVDVFFNKNLSDRRSIQAGLGYKRQLLRCIGHSAPSASKSEGRTDDHGIADCFPNLQRPFYIMGNVGGNHRLTDLGHRFLEQLPVLGLINGVGIGAEQCDPVLFKKALVRQLHGNGQTRLPPKPCKKAVRLFLFDNSFHRFLGQRLQIDLIGQGAVGHDRCRVGIDQHHIDSGLLQNTAGLCARIVKFCRLSDHNGTGADDHYFFYILIQRHSRFPPSWK